MKYVSSSFIDEKVLLEPQKTGSDTCSVFIGTVDEFFDSGPRIMIL